VPVAVAPVAPAVAAPAPLATPAPPPRPHVADRAAPSLPGVAWRRFVVDLKVFVRNGQSVGFTLAFPIMMLFLFASIFSGQVDGTDVTVSQLYVAGLIGSSALATGFVNTAIGVAFDRERGELKRLAGTPMPKAAFFLGRGGSVLAMTFAQVAVLLGIGVALYDLSLPTTIGRWATFFGVLTLGTLGSTLLGLAVGGRIRNAKAAPAVVNLPFVFLQFISGVFIPFSDLPAGMRFASGFFPLRWLSQGMRSVFLPDAYVVAEPSGSWQRGLTWGVLLVWAVVGLVVCVRWFRWVDDERWRSARGG
jgi:ABC-2 type transport system permease protein